MKQVLKRIMYGKYDEFCEIVISSLPNIDSGYFEKWETMTEEVLYNDQPLELDIDENDFLTVLDEVQNNNTSNPKQAIDIKFSKMLYRQLSLNTNIPSNILYEKEVWAYINCFVLFEVVRKRYFSKEGDFENINRVSRVLLSDCSNIDRTGMRWLWSLSDATYSEDYLFRFTETAHRFIDPVKALYERELGSNRILFKAFIRSIQLLNYDPRIRSSKYRSILMTHLRNLATLKIYESYSSVDELAKIFANDIKIYLGDSPIENFEEETTEDDED